MRHLRNAVILAAGVLALVVSTPAQSERLDHYFNPTLYRVAEGEAVSSVRTDAFCVSEAACRRIAEAFSISIEAAQAEYTAQLATGTVVYAGGKMVVPVYQVLDPAYQDFEGDTFYVVDVGSGYFTLLWPGMNGPAQVPSPTSFRI